MLSDMDFSQLIQFKKTELSQIEQKTICLRCKERVLQGGQQPVFVHDITKNCNAILCIWCCDKIFTQNENRKQKKQKGKTVNCCNFFIPDFYQQLKSFLQHNCVICGTQCKSNRAVLNPDTYLNVGEQCFKLMKNKSNIFTGRSDVLKKIQQLVMVKCVQCEKLKLNWLTVDSVQKDTHLCGHCIKKQMNKQESFQKNVRKCSLCEQWQIFQKLGYLNTRFGKQTILQLRQVQKDWQISHKQGKKNEIQLLCSYCLYEKYLKLEKQYQNLLKNKQYYRSKKKFQVYFVKYCMVCAKQAKKQQKTYKIYSTKEDSIVAFMCLNCYKCREKNSRKYLCYNKLNQFLQKTKQSDLNEFNVILKEQFDYDANKQIANLKILKDMKTNDKSGNEQIGLLNKNRGNQIQGKFDEPDIDQKFQDVQFKQTNNNNCRGKDLFWDEYKPNEVIITSKACISAPEQHNANIQQSIDHNNQSLLDLELKQYQPLINKQKPHRLQQDPLNKERLQLISIKQLYESLRNESKVQELVSDPHQHNNWDKGMDGFEGNKNKNVWIDAVPEKCVFYENCYNSQILLHLNVFCLQCFLKYLMGDECIASKIQSDYRIISRIAQTDKLETKPYKKKQNVKFQSQIFQ